MHYANILIDDNSPATDKVSLQLLHILPGLSVVLFHRFSFEFSLSAQDVELSSQYLHAVVKSTKGIEYLKQVGIFDL